MWGWLYGWKLDGWMVGRLDNWTFGWLAGAGWLDGWIIRWLDGWMVRWIAGWMVGWLDDWTLGQLDGWMVGWGWMVG